MGDIAYNYIVIARQLATNNSFKKSFEMYLCGFEKLTRVKKRFEAEFRTVLSKMNEYLAAIDNKTEIFINFERAMKMFPESAELLNDIGEYLYKYKYFSEAMCHFEKALKIDNSFVSIEKNLNNAKRSLFPRCRFRMLNDKVRNDAFREAIRSCVSPADSVLNIDAGVGLLALYANECSPIAITACESSTTMARLAEFVLHDNTAQVAVINKHPMTLHRTDTYGTRTVLITDTFNAALFGDHVLQSICHAWEKLLDKNSKVIPGRAEYFVTGVRCEQLNNKYKLCDSTKSILNVEHMHVHTTLYLGETYNGENVSLYDDLQYMCEPRSLFSIDFNDYHDVCEKLCRQEPYIAELNAQRDGELNSMIGWFNLHLTEDIMITNDPRSDDKSNAWPQAVFFDVLPKTLSNNDTITVPFTTYGGKLNTLQDPSTTIKRISPETLAFLNDTEYMNMITKCVGTVCVHLGQTVDITYVDMVDLNPFPMFGVLMMKRGANSLICHAKTIEDKEFLLAVLKTNQIPENRVTILLSDSWCHNTFKGKQFHVIFGNFIDYSGDLDAEKKRIMQHLKFAHLLDGGLCLPETVTIMGQLISSISLETNNRILDENVDYKLARHLNHYQTSQALNLDIARMDFKPLSEEFVISCCSFMNSEALSVTVSEDGECHAVLCWYKVQLLKNVAEVYTNRSGSFVQSMAYMTTRNVPVFRGDQVNVLKCVEDDHYFKLVLDLEP